MRTDKQRRFDKWRTKKTASEYHWNRMTKAEKDWLTAFEVSEAETERGHVANAIEALLEVGIVPSDRYVQGMRERREEEANPTRAESKIKRDRKYYNYQGKRAPKSNMYDSSDYVRVMPGKVNKDDLGFEAIYSTKEVLDNLANDDTSLNENEALATVERSYRIDPGLNPDETAVMINPEDGMIEAIDQARSKHRSLEKLIEDAKLSKEAKANLIELTQAFTYEAMTYTMHGNEYMNLNYVLRGVNGSLYVQDQHDRVQTLALYLKRHTEDSYATHANIYWPDGLRDVWVFQRGQRSNIEGKAVLYASLQVPMSQPG